VWIPEELEEKMDDEEESERGDGTIFVIMR